MEKECPMIGWSQSGIKCWAAGAVALAAFTVLPLTDTHAQTDLPDFQNIQDLTTKKVEFFRYLLPLVQAENQRLSDIRRRLGYIQDHLRFRHPLTPEDLAWLAAVREEFRLPPSHLTDPGFWPTLLRRVDTVPVDLVLVQAANESGWGTSRFAREGNNLFGEWCFRPGCGIVPAERPVGATYEVAVFDSVSDCISSYMFNLNTGRVYEKLRVIREEGRAEGRSPEADELASGLAGYSQRGHAYVAEIRAMLRQNAPVIAQLGPR